MTYPRLDMDLLLELVRLHRLGHRVREVARLLGVSPNTERPYREALEAAGLLDGSPDELPSREELKAAVDKHAPPKVAAHQASSIENWKLVVEELWKAGAGPTAIYDRLRLEHEDFEGTLSAVKRLCLRLSRERGVQAKDVAIPVETEPGEVAQVDFGFVGRLYDPAEGVVRKTWAFVLVLGHSRHMAVRLCMDQRVETWLRLHVECFAELGGVPKVIVPDNLKAAVVRSAFGADGDRALQRSYRELARHYGFVVDPTPPYAPEKKGKVEAAVKYVKRNFFAARPDIDLAQARAQLPAWVREVAGQRVHGTTAKRPLEVFEQEEAAALLSLPTKLFEPMRWKTAKVHPDSHIYFDRRLYSVPWRLVGKDVWIRATSTTVAIYLEEQRIATHQRRSPGPRSTVETHLPEHRVDLRHRSREYWEARADKMGEEVGSYVREIFDSDDVLSQLRKVQAIVTHLETFPVERARAACLRASFYANFSYKGIKTILSRALDLQPLPQVVTETAEPGQKHRFARRPEELLQLPLEVTDEPN